MKVLLENTHTCTHTAILLVWQEVATSQCTTLLYLPSILFTQKQLINKIGDRKMETKILNVLFVCSSSWLEKWGLTFVAKRVCLAFSILALLHNTCKWGAPEEIIVSSEHTNFTRRIAVPLGLELIGKKKRISHYFYCFKVSSTHQSNTDQCLSDHCPTL